MSFLKREVNDERTRDVHETGKQSIRNNFNQPQEKTFPKNRFSFLGKLFLMIIGIFTIYIMFANGKHSFQVTKASVTVLLRENALELVTNKVTTMVACTLEDVADNTKGKIIDVAFGKGEGVLIAKVKYTYGIDLEEITEDNVSIDGQTIIVTLPEPKLFDLSVDLDREYYSKTPILRAILNKFINEDPQKMIEAAFVGRARDFAQENHLEPSKSEIIERITVFFNNLLKLGNSKHKIVFK